MTVGIKLPSVLTGVGIIKKAASEKVAFLSRGVLGQWEKRTLPAEEQWERAWSLGRTERQAVNRGGVTARTRGG